MPSVTRCHAIGLPCLEADGMDATADGEWQTVQAWNGFKEHQAKRAMAFDVLFDVKASNGTTRTYSNSEWQASRQT